MPFTRFKRNLTQHISDCSLSWQYSECIQMASWSSYFAAASLVVFFSVFAVSSARKFVLEWSLDGVRAHNLSNPLQVELGDTILLNCPSGGDFAFSNLWLTKHQQLYDGCDCSTVVTESGDPELNGQCHTSSRIISLDITSYDGDLNSVFSFDPGETCYLISFAPENSLNGSLSQECIQGQCLMGLKMAIQIAALPTESSDTEVNSNATVAESMPSTSETIVHTNSLGGSGESGSGITETIGRPQTGNETTTVSVSASRVQLRDWHVAVIFILAAVAMSAVLMAGIATLVLWLRRSRPVVKGDISQNTGCNPYPNDIFNDPLE